MPTPTLFDWAYGRHCAMPFVSLWNCTHGLMQWCYRHVLPLLSLPVITKYLCVPMVKYVSDVTSGLVQMFVSTKCRYLVYCFFHWKHGKVPLIAGHSCACCWPLIVSNFQMNWTEMQLQQLPRCHHVKYLVLVLPLQAIAAAYPFVDHCNTSKARRANGDFRVLIHCP